MGETERAIGVLEQAVAKSAEGDPSLRYHLGMALYKSGRLDEAKEELKKALDAGKSFPGKEQSEEILKKLG